MEDKLLLSNFWEDVYNVLLNFSEIGNAETKDITLTHVNQFNNAKEYYGNFDKLLKDILHIYMHDSEVRKSFAYSDEEQKTLITYLQKAYDKTADLMNSKLADKMNKALQLWREQKFEDKVEDVVIPEVPKTAPLSNEHLSDFGEKIGGAKKDLWQRLEHISSDDIKTKPLSKSFPEPDYAKLFADGVINQDGAILIKFVYDAIPPKPRKSYRVDSWAKQVQNAIDIMMMFVSERNENTEFLDKFIVGLRKTLGRDLDMFTKTMKGLNFPQNNVKLGNFKISYFDSISKRNSETGEMEDHKGVYTIVNGYSIIKDFSSFEEAVAGLGKILDATKEENKGKKGTTFGIFQDRRTKDIFISKKGVTVGDVRLVEGFKTVGEASKYIKENQEKLQAMWDALTKPVNERPNINKERVGVDYRNGENISAEKLAQKFSFRGIEFGNYVNPKERQDHVNGAFDALMDLATALNITTEDLALGGKLGLAFGSRGSGGKNSASAHYEPEKVVINLTKNKGAGTLAHEYWHALDNYFAKMRGENIGYISSKPKPLIMNKSYVEGSRDVKDFYDRRISHDLLDAFKGIMDAIGKSGLYQRSLNLDKTRTKAYWSTPYEMSARCFENYIISKLGQTGQQNDYLANFSDMSGWITDGGLQEDTYPYPTKDEEASINEAYDQFFVVLHETQHLEGSKENVEPKLTISIAENDVLVALVSCEDDNIKTTMENIMIKCIQPKGVVERCLRTLLDKKIILMSDTMLFSLNLDPNLNYRVDTVK